GLRAAAHAPGGGGMRIAAAAGVDSIAHATLMDQRTVRDLKERDIPIVPTLCAVHFILENAATLPPVVVERTRAVSERHREGVRLARKAGVRIAAGTDAGSPFNRHERYAVELRLLAECGLSEEEVLIAATSTPIAANATMSAGAPRKTATPFARIASPPNTTNATAKRAPTMAPAIAPCTLKPPVASRACRTLPATRPTWSGGKPAASSACAASLARS